GWLGIKRGKTLDPPYASHSERVSTSRGMQRNTTHSPWFETPRYASLLIRNLGNSGGGDWFDVYCISEVLKAPDEALCVSDFGAALEVVGAEVLVGGAVLEDVVDGGEDRGGDGADRLLFPAAAAQAEELSLQVASVLALGRPGALDERGLEPVPAFAHAGGAALASALVVARTHVGPRQQVPGGSEAAHIDAGLGGDCLGTERTYSRDGADEVDGDAKGGEVGLDLLVDGGEGAIEAVDLPEMELQQKAMMVRHPSTQCFLQTGARALHVRMRQRGEPNRIALAGDHRVEDRAAALAEHVRKQPIEL